MAPAPAGSPVSGAPARRPAVLPLTVMLAVAAVGGLIAWAAVTGGDSRGGGVIVALPPPPKAEAAAEAEPAATIPLPAAVPEQVLPPPVPVEAPPVAPPPAEAIVPPEAEGTAHTPAPEPASAGHPASAGTHPETPAVPAPAAAAEAMAPATPAAPSPKGIALSPAPDPALVENGSDGLLPVIGPDGRQPWQVYARPFGDKTARPRIAIIVAGLGLKESTSAEAIDRLPPDVTLAFTPYARNLDEWSARARAGGHELLIQVPMEPVDFPTSDPGPKALMTNLSAADNRSRLEWTLARTTGYVGVMTYMGSRFTADAGAIQATAALLKARGLMIVDSRTAEQSAIPAVAGHMGLPRAVATRFIDATPTRAAVDARLAELERFARQNGAAIGIASDYPGSIERIASWAAGLEARGLVLAPASALADTIATE